MDCLAKEPEKRPQSAKEVKARLSGPGHAPAKPDMGIPAGEVGPGGTMKIPAGARAATPAGAKLESASQHP